MGTLLFITIDDLIMDFAKVHDLHDYMILIVSNDISGSLKLRASNYGISSNIQFESKYDNIEFVSSLAPTPAVLEMAFSDKRIMSEKYHEQLIRSEPYMDAVCVADMIINQNSNVLIVSTSLDVASGTVGLLRDFIEDSFMVTGYQYSKIKQLCEYYGKPEYDKMIDTLPYDIPETFDGTNPEVIWSNSIDEDIESVKENLENEKLVATSMVAPTGEEDELTSIFYNRFTEDIEDKIRETLMAKEFETIKYLCRNSDVRVRPKDTKEMLVNKYMMTLKSRAARSVEYAE